MLRTSPVQCSESVWFVIPAYNEAQVVGDVVRGIQNAFHNVVVVDDCSSDATGDNANKAGAHVLRHPLNLGQGAALQTGIIYALGQGAQFVVTFDADGQHDVQEVFKMLEVQAETQADVVLGSRFLGEAKGMPASRRIVLRAATIFTRLTSGLDLSDVHNGLRLMTRSAACRIRLEQNRMAHASEFLDQLKPLGMRVVEAPVTISYTEYSLAKGQRSSASFRILFEIIAGWLRR